MLLTPYKTHIFRYHMHVKHTHTHTGKHTHTHWQTHAHIYMKTNATVVVTRNNKTRYIMNDYVYCVPYLNMIFCLTAGEESHLNLSHSVSVFVCTRIAIKCWGILAMRVRCMYTTYIPASLYPRGR